ncbi:RNA ligase family protein [Streptomyces sp. NRRL S-378]|uniref:RNA ligase family protein n=1 Tax=Streptomyces sp. NRRL S-378 TaxID=1463904 RepID=UPI0004C67257|nr:RNA ligase family protein [Streptomyces sp. NRRL S-378]
MTDFEFTPWPKTARLFRDIVITEKIDGTNAAIHIAEDGRVAAQSRNRLITPDSDNYGFAKWVHTNADSLHQILGTGLHYGEWWGHGIQRGYGMTERRFSLFNTSRWVGQETMHGDIDPVIQLRDGSLSAVPVMYHGTFSEARVHHALMSLKLHGSHAAPGFMNPEGICIFHTQTRSVFKVTLDHNDAGKWEAA